MGVQHAEDDFEGFARFPPRRDELCSFRLFQRDEELVDGGELAGVEMGRGQ